MLNRYFLKTQFTYIGTMKERRRIIIVAGAAAADLEFQRRHDQD